ncbi:MAG TPA: tRNA epoxyqueuosine(34) reductase QueG [Longimicrobiales bacterium]|nr:tRNA epoxyqueuosine(34) reductase QueG [Longimicrobiales bacterium]
MSDLQTLAARIKDEASRLGFDLAGIAPCERSPHADYYREWLAADRHGEMQYLARPDAVQRRLDPPAELRSAIVVGLNYYNESDGEGEGENVGTIARYARGRDYHKVIKRQLLSLLDWLEHETGQTLPAARAYVDTGPVLERELAQRAGLGWFGRNTMLINPRQGSYFFLGVLLVELKLTHDEPFTADHCGSCQACITACPTGALLGRDQTGAPVMDATRCISYLTIEHRGPIPRELRSLIGNRIFGCDICQEVCPWNSPKFVQITREASFLRGSSELRRDLISLMEMDEAEWDRFSRGSAIRRAKRSGFLRNVAVALGNSGDPKAVPALAGALRDVEPLVRGHAAWALGTIGSAEARNVLIHRLQQETDGYVREEIDCALSGLESDYPRA